MAPISPVQDLTGQTALVTGAARRIGAEVCRQLHAAGMNLVVHYRSSGNDARALKQELEQQRPRSVLLVRADLRNAKAPQNIIRRTLARWGRLDALINNASAFYATPLESFDRTQWRDLVDTNLTAPLFLAQAAAPHLREQQGAIINITDVHSDRPLKDYPVYSITKAGLAMLTRSLARELAPQVRVNAVAPGAIEWPEQPLPAKVRRRIIDATALKRGGESADIARAVLYLLRDAPYVTGQELAIDGGRSLHD